MRILIVLMLPGGQATSPKDF